MPPAETCATHVPRRRHRAQDKEKKKKYEGPVATRVGKKKKKKGPDAAHKLPQSTAMRSWATVSKTCPD